MMDCTLLQLHMLKKLEFDGNRSKESQVYKMKYMEMVASESYYTCEL